MELEKAKELLISWVRVGKHFHYKEEDFIYIDGDYIRMTLFTYNNKYSISAHIGNHDYLGCTVSSRKPRAGETWTRGADLADGPFSHETWVRIIGDIVGYELVKIHKPIQQERVGIVDEG